MVEEQLRGRGISDARVLQAMDRVPRHRFVPGPVGVGVYEDYPLSIGCNQTISQPYMVALMTEGLALQGGEQVLEIGTGSGYQTAILAELAGEVFTVERFPNLSARAEATLTDLGYTNVRFRVGDGTLGWPEEAPFDRILCTAAAPRPAKPWIEQLMDGGRLVAPVGERYGQTLTIFTKRGDGLAKREVCGCVFVPLVGEYGWPAE
jgi:protein-L-isoaspartate(D-aspartate) O-methyltransferase